MSISLECRDCGSRYRVRDDKAGKRFACKECRATITVPSNDGADDLGGDDYGDGYGDDGDDWGTLDYDLPSRRRRTSSRYDDDDDDAVPEPRKKKRRKKKSSVNPGAIVGGVIGGIVVIALVIGGIMFISNSFSPYGKHKRLANDMLAVMEDLMAVMESIQDERSARDAADKIDRITDRLEALAKRQRDLPKITKSEDAELGRYFRDKFRSMQDRAKTASSGARRFVRSEPKLTAALLRLAQVSRKLKNSPGF